MSDAGRFLGTIVSALDAAKIPYMLAGSFASSHHGAPRATQDIDIVIDPTFATLDIFLGAIARADAYCDPQTARDEFKRRGQFNVIDDASAWKVDLIFRKARAFSREELARRVSADVLGVAVLVASAEDTILSKLEWALLGESERQLRDVRGIVDVRGDSLDRGYIERWLDDLGVRSLWDRINCET